MTKNGELANRRLNSTWSHHIDEKTTQMVGRLGMGEVLNRRGIVEVVIEAKNRGMCFDFTAFDIKGMSLANAGKIMDKEGKLLTGDDLIFKMLQVLFITQKQMDELETGGVTCHWARLGGDELGPLMVGPNETVIGNYQAIYWNKLLENHFAMLNYNQELEGGTVEKVKQLFKFTGPEDVVTNVGLSHLEKEVFFRYAKLNILPRKGELLDPNIFELLDWAMPILEDSLKKTEVLFNGKKPMDCQDEYAGPEHHLVPVKCISYDGYKEMADRGQLGEVYVVSEPLLRVWNDRSYSYGDFTIAMLLNQVVQDIGPDLLPKLDLCVMANSVLFSVKKGIALNEIENDKINFLQKEKWLNGPGRERVSVLVSSHARPKNAAEIDELRHSTSLGRLTLEQLLTYFHSTSVLEDKFSPVDISMVAAFLKCIELYEKKHGKKSESGLF